MGPGAAQIMRAYRSTPHSSTQETPNFLMLGRETRVPEHLTYHVPAPESPVHEYGGKLVETMGKAHDALRAQQWQIWKEDSAKLQPKFVGPYCVTEVLPNHTYRVERSGQTSL